MNDDDRTMLALAALTYRGIAGNEAGSERAIRDKLRPWLGELDRANLGEWQLVWGPASFRVPISLVDDAMAYAVRRIDLPTGAAPHYAIAIRGTNPVSLFDWVFGDLWVGYQVPWSEDASQALLSASTSLGDTIIRHLAAEDPPSDSSQFLGLTEDLVDAVGSFIHKAGKLEVKSLSSLLEMRNDDLREHIKAVMDDSTRGLREGMMSGLGRLFAVANEISEPLRREVGRAVLGKLRARIAATRGRDQGRTLLEFLNGIEAKGARVSVTGHSKGGALSYTTALWLEEEWARAAGARIECFSFAGPTAGNSGFAEHYNAALGKRTRRIVNRSDLVPHAWHSDELRRIAGVYPALRDMIELLADSVARFDYRHLGGDSVCVEFSGGLSSERSLFKEIIHQHLDAYFAAAGLGEPWDAVAIMTRPD